MSPTAPISVGSTTIVPTPPATPLLPSVWPFPSHPSLKEWCIEVKPGQTVKCAIGENTYMHLSQAFFRNRKEKGNENVDLFVKCDDHLSCVGNLSAKYGAQMSCDVAFGKEFELSTSSMSMTVYFLGYMRGKLEIKEVQSEIDTFAKGNAISADLKAKICHRRPSETPSRKRKAKMIVPVSTQERGKLEAKEVQWKGELDSTWNYVRRNYIRSRTVKNLIIAKSRIIDYRSKEETDKMLSSWSDIDVDSERCKKILKTIGCWYC